MNKERILQIHKKVADYDTAIDSLNIQKRKCLSEMITLLKDSTLLEQVKNVQEVDSAQFKIWEDYEDPNWCEVELIIFTEKKQQNFDDWRDWDKYDGVIRNKICEVLEPFGFIMVTIE